MEWAAFERVEGPLLLHDRIDFAAASVAHTIALSQGMKHRSGRDLRVQDFLIDWDQQEQVVDTGEELGRALATAAFLNRGEDLSPPSPPSS